MSKEYTPGGDPDLLHRVGPSLALVLVLLAMVCFGDVAVICAGGLIAAICASGVASHLWRDVRVCCRVVSVHKLGETKKVLVITDQHFGDFTQAWLIRRTIRLIKSLGQIDYVVFGGDSIDLKGARSLAKFEDFVRQLRKALPVTIFIAVPGNHEIEDYDGIRRVLGQYGAIWLENSWTVLNGIAWYGQADPSHPSHQPDPDVAHWLDAMRREMAELLHLPMVGIFHHPPQVDNPEALWPDLILSGHVHRGFCRRFGEAATSWILVVGASLGAATGCFGWLLPPIWWRPPVMTLLTLHPREE